MDINPFIKQIKHSKCINGIEECSVASAIKVDDADGIAVYIGFSGPMFNRPDYLDVIDCSVKLIELSDLNDYARLYNDLVSSEEYKQIKPKEQRERRRAFWAIPKDEINRKWSGGIAISERFLRRLSVNFDPKYQFLLVVKNDCDIRMLDTFIDQVSGSVHGFECCITNDVPDHVSAMAF